jgi:hypothetical protein
VTIYGDDYYEEEEEASSASSAAAQFMESLSQNCRASLSRLACAFAPPGHLLHPHDLESAHVLSVNDHQIDISAVLCEADGCIQVFVPVTFPRSCSDSPDMEECILENIEELDHQAYSMIAQENYKVQNYEQVQDDERIYMALAEEPIADSMPLWWTFPQFTSAGLDKECRNVKSLLNEADFRDEIQALATQELLVLYRRKEEPVQVVAAVDVLKVAVAAVGPSGILLRAQIRQVDVQRESGERVSMVDLPVQFSQEAGTREDLRASVLGLVEMAAATTVA